MTTSGTTTFDCTRDEIISDALANVGGIGPGKSATGAAREHAARALNRLVKAIDAEGDFLWRAIRRTVTLTASTATYTLGADVLSVDDPMSYKLSTNESRTPVRLISRDDYMAITDRTSTGTPTMAFLEIALPTTVTLTLWPVPDTTSATVEYTAMLRAQEYATGANTGDFPARWLDCLVAGLSWKLAPSYAQGALAASYRKEYEDEKERQLNAGGERGGFRMVPWGSFGGGY